MRVANIIEDSRIAGPQIRNLKIAKALKDKIYITLIFPKKNSNKLKTMQFTWRKIHASIFNNNKKKSVWYFSLYSLFSNRNNNACKVIEKK